MGTTSGFRLLFTVSFAHTFQLMSSGRKCCSQTTDLLVGIHFHWPGLSLQMFCIHFFRFIGSLGKENPSLLVQPGTQQVGIVTLRSHATRTTPIRSAVFAFIVCILGVAPLFGISKICLATFANPPHCIDIIQR